MSVTTPPCCKNCRLSECVRRSPVAEIGPLPTTINALFNRKSFRNCSIQAIGLNRSNEAQLCYMRYSVSQQHFERMKPALLLASHFIEKATPLFAKVMFAESDSAIDGHCLDIKFEPDTLHLANMDLTLIEVFKILCMFRSGSKEGDQISRATCVNLAARFLDVEHPKIHCSKERPPLAIVLNADLIDLWLKPESVWKETHEHTKQMYSFELAVILVHEMAHAVWMLRKLQTQDLLVISPDLAIIHGEERPSEFQASQKELLDALRELRKKWSYFDRVRKRQDSTTCGLPEIQVRFPTSRIEPIPIWQQKILEPLTSLSDPEPELGRACEEYILGKITWGVYWKTKEQMVKNEKTGKDRKRVYRVGKPLMYFAPWISETGVNTEAKPNSGRHVAGWGPFKEILEGNAGGCEKFIARSDGMFTQVDEKFPQRVFENNQMCRERLRQWPGNRLDLIK